MLLCRMHIFADLEPYVCTFQSCRDALFSTRFEWFRHETACHRRRWRCVWCHNEIFVSEPALKAHLLSVHNNTVTEDQIPLVIELAEEDIRYFGDSACPLCDEWSPESPSNKIENWREFRRHLGRHMQQTALVAIPLFIEGLEIRDSGHLPSIDGRDIVYCHECQHEWYRDQHGFVCPECGSEFTEIVSVFHL